MTTELLIYLKREIENKLEYLISRVDMVDQEEQLNKVLDDLRNIHVSTID